MKALVKNLDSTRLVDMDVPSLDAVNNVLVQVKLAAICRTDLYVSKGLVPSADKVILGHEFYGIVTAITPGVRNLQVGDKVTIDPTRFGEARNLMCGVRVDGAFAEYIKVPDHAVYKLPEHLQPALCVIVEPVAAALAVLNAPISPSMSGCIYGDNRIAQLTCRLMRLKGYDIVTHSEDAPLEANRYDYIIETIAQTEHFARMFEGVKPGGLIILKSRQYRPVEIVINTLVQKNITLSAVHYGDFNEAIDLLASGKLDLSDLIGETYQLEAFDDAFQAAEKSESRKCYLKV